MSNLDGSENNLTKQICIRKAVGRYFWNLDSIDNTLIRY